MAENSGSIDDILIALPREEQTIVKRLRLLVKECIPKASEHVYPDMSFPFYRHNRLICFISPASIPWKTNLAPENKNEIGTSLGFNQGNLMSNEDGVLLAEGRKQVYAVYFKSVKDIDENRIRALLFEAAMIDELFGKKKSKERPR